MRSRLMSTMMLLGLVLAISFAMNINLSNREDHIQLSVGQENQAATFLLDLHKESTAYHLYALVQKTSGFNEDAFIIYEDERKIPRSAKSLPQLGIQDGAYLTMKLKHPSASSSPTPPGPSSPPPPSSSGLLLSPKSASAPGRLRKASSRESLRSSTGPERRFVACRTPRFRIERDRIVEFYRFSQEDQARIRQAFYNDIIMDKALTIHLERVHPELIEAMFNDINRFWTLLTPQMMLDIDAAQKTITPEPFSSEEEEEPEEAGINPMQAPHVLIEFLASTEKIPMLFDLVVMDSTMSLAAYRLIYGEAAAIPTDPIDIDGLVGDQKCVMNLLSVSVIPDDQTPWITLGYAALKANNVLIDFEADLMVVNDQAIPIIME